MDVLAKILVVDDNLVILNATRRVLEQAGYETLGTSDGEAALQAARNDRPDLILLDVNMPGMSGFEVCRRVKNDPTLAGIFILILSSTAIDSDSYVEGLSMGADGYINRPIANRELLARVQAMLRIQAVEHALQASDVQWSATFDAVADAILLTDANCTILKCNQAAAEMWQRPSEALVGKKCYQVVHGLETPVAACPLERVCATKRREVMTFNQNDRWLEAKVDPMFDAKGNFTGTVHVIADITERKHVEDALHESEKRFRALIENISDAITLLDARGKVVYDSPAAPGMLGYTPEDWIGREVFELVHPADLPEIQNLFQYIVETPGARVDPIFRLHHKSGSWLWIEMVATNLLSEPGVEAIVLNYRDISERKRAEDALRESERQMQALVTSLDDIVFEFDEKGTYLNTWTSNESLLALPKTETLGRRLPEILGTELARLFLESFRRVLASGQREDIEYPLEVISGQRWFLARISAVAVPDGAAKTVCVLVRDITERKQAEVALRESEAFSQAILNNSPIGISVRSRTGQLISANDAWKKIWAMPDYDLHEDISRDRASLDFDSRDDYLKQHQDEVRRIYEKGGHFHLPELKTTYTRPGAAEWISQHFYAIQDEQGQVNRVVILTEDITERKQVERTLRDTSERLAHMLANSPTVIYALDVEGERIKPIWISANIESILGYSAEDGLKPEWWPGQIHPQDRPSALAALEHLLDDFYQHEYRFLRKDGRLVWLHDEHRLLRDEDNQPWEIVGAWTDITARKQVEDALKEYNTRLETAVEARTRELRETQEQLVRQERLAVLGQLAGGVGHELRNPLSIINNAIYFLRIVQPDASENVREYLGIIETETHNADKIISDLLDFSRIKSVDVEPVTVPVLFNRVLERFPVPENVQVTLNLPDSLPVIYVDPRQITQVLGNLVLNAYQAMVSTSSTNAVSAGPTTNGSKVGDLTLSAKKKGKMVAIAIADTGVGIPPENMKKLFEPLFTTKPKGIGLGLAVSKKLAEANGGRIEVESEPGRGTTFTLYLPLAQGIQP